MNETVLIGPKILIKRRFFRQTGRDVSGAHASQRNPQALPGRQEKVFINRPKPP
jgi:hypothetical protein